MIDHLLIILHTNHVPIFSSRFLFRWLSFCCIQPWHIFVQIYHLQCYDLEFGYIIYFKFHANVQTFIFRTHILNCKLTELFYNDGRQNCLFANAMTIKIESSSFRFFAELFWMSWLILTNYHMLDEHYLFAFHTQVKVTNI